jgi:hypothetical protein
VKKMSPGKHRFPCVFVWARHILPRAARPRGVGQEACCTFTSQDDRRFAVGDRTGQSFPMMMSILRMSILGALCNMNNNLSASAFGSCSMCQIILYSYLCIGISSIRSEICVGVNYINNADRLRLALVEFSLRGLSDCLEPKL